MRQFERRISSGHRSGNRSATGVQSALAIASWVRSATHLAGTSQCSRMCTSRMRAPALTC
jgi:hypothetical protein